MNQAISGRISDHDPVLADIPFEEPRIERPVESPERMPAPMRPSRPRRRVTLYESSPASSNEIE